MYLKGIDPEPKGAFLLKIIEKDENKTCYTSMLSLCKSLNKIQISFYLDRQLIKLILVHYADQDFINSETGRVCFQDCLLDLLASTRQGDGYIEEQDWLLLKPLAAYLSIEYLTYKPYYSLSLISTLILCCPDHEVIKQYIQNILDVKNMTREQFLDSDILHSENSDYRPQLYKNLGVIGFTLPIRRAFL
jgi:hypothetical protein